MKNWQYKFSNFEKAFQAFSRLIERYNSSNTEQNDEAVQMAVTQAFEFTFELCWKTLKEYLQEEEDFNFINSPNKTIRQALQAGIIKDSKQGTVWMEALKQRNNTVHTYNVEILESTLKFITEEFYIVLNNWYIEFKKK